MNSVLYCLHNLSQKSHLRRMEKFTQHGDTSCLLHTIAVAYYSIKIAEFFGIKYKKRDLIRGALWYAPQKLDTFGGAYFYGKERAKI